MTELHSLLAPLASRLAAVQERAAALADEERALKAEIRSVVAGEPGLYAAGGVDISVQVNRRFNERRALAALPEEFLPLVTSMERSIDRQRLQALAPAVYEDAWDVGEPRVGLR